MKKYWVQLKAPAGNWYDHLGSDDKTSAINDAAYLREKERLLTRVVERTDVQVYPEVA